MQKKTQIKNSKIKKEQINIKEEVDLINPLNSNQNIPNNNINEELYEKINQNNSSTKIGKQIFLNNKFFIKNLYFRKIKKTN